MLGCSLFTRTGEEFRSCHSHHPFSPYIHSETEGKHVCQLLPVLSARDPVQGLDGWFVQRCGVHSPLPPSIFPPCFLGCLLSLIFQHWRLNPAPCTGLHLQTPAFNIVFFFKKNILKILFKERKGREFKKNKIEKMRKSSIKNSKY